jgi:hypothetical protein
LFHIKFIACQGHDDDDDDDEIKTLGISDVYYRIYNAAKE